MSGIALLKQFTNNKNMLFLIWVFLVQNPIFMNVKATRMNIKYFWYMKMQWNLALSLSLLFTKDKNKCYFSSEFLYCQTNLTSNISDTCESTMDFGRHYLSSSCENYEQSALYDWWQIYHLNYTCGSQAK